MVAALSAQGVRVSPERLLGAYLQKLQDPLCDQLVAQMDEAGIQRSILLAADLTYALRDCRTTIEESFHHHQRVLERHPGRFDVFGGVDPRWGQDGVKLFEHALVALGFRGFKVYPPCGFSPSAPELFPYYELCAHHGVPVVVHIGPTSPSLAFDFSSPFLVDEAARRFPSVSFILAHGAVSLAEECALLCAYRPNVYLDISGYQRDLTGEALRRVVSRGINHKILFGTDWPVFRMQDDQRSFVELVAGDGGPLAELSELEANLILHANAERLLSRATQPYQHRMEGRLAHE